MDLHKKGVFAVVSPANEVLMDTFDSTGYSARANFVRAYNMLWSKATEAGYCIREFVAVAPEAAMASVPARDSMKSMEFRIPVSVQGWQLYDKAGAADAANVIRDALQAKLSVAHALARGKSQAEVLVIAQCVRNEMYAVMNAYRNLGARDSEPECVLVEVIEEALGLPVESLSR